MSKFKYKTKVDPSNGIWNTEDDSSHIQDRKLTKGLIDFFSKKNAKSIVDLGCGAGYYVKSFADMGLEVKGYDGNPNTPKITNGMCGIKDLSIPFKFDEPFDWVMSLEVGEHLPKKYEDIFLDNLINNCKSGIVISWAVKGQGGSGHFNEQNNDYIKNKMKERGFHNDIESENLLRGNCSLWWFRGSVMVFNK